MRDENIILAEIIDTKTAYATIRQDRQSTLRQTEDAEAEIKRLSRELDATVSRGAQPCPNCGATPMGMLKTPAYVNNGTDYPNLWEVGCAICPPILQERDDGKELIVNGETVKVKRRSYSARGFSPAEAVRKWNEGKWVEDFLFDRIPGFVAELAS